MILFCAVLVPCSASAACGTTGEPWVSLDLQGDWPHGLGENLLADLRASLRLRGIEVCQVNDNGATKPLALVELHVSAAERVLVSIDVHDAITNKRVLRDVDLHKVAPDARGLLLAQAADELLRASWVELSLQDAPAPAIPPPVQVTEAVSVPLGPLRPLPKALGGRFALEHHGGGQTLLGPDAFLEFWLAERFGAAIALGARAGLIARGVDGRVESHAFTLTTGVLVPLWPSRSRYNLRAMLAAHMAELKIRGLAHPGARGSSLSGLSISARAAVSGELRLSDLVHISLEVGAGLPVRSVAAYDDNHEVLSTSGVAVHGLLGIGAML